MGEGSDGTDPVKSTSDCGGNIPEGKREEDDMDQTGGHPHWTAWGVFWTTLAANVGTCRPARPKNLPVRSQGAIPPTTVA